MTQEKHLIIGASSGIAKALAKKLATNQGENLLLVSRDFSQYDDEQFSNSMKISISDYSEQTISLTCEQLTSSLLEQVTQVYMCNGLLHTPVFLPEKQLANFSANQFSQTMFANALTPMLWLTHLVTKLKAKPFCKVVVFSARIGSISDNQLGGWYSYRASKSALNMMLKTAAIELKRTAKHIKLIAFHPGTTDTALSRPFQKRVAQDKLFTTDFVAQQLLEIVKRHQVDGELSYVDWQDKVIAW